ncbi:hypothetical protein D3C87_109680 [compost metagenome]
MKQLNRRQFLTATGVIGGIAALSIPASKFILNNFSNHSYPASFLTQGFAVSNGPRELPTAPFFGAPRKDEHGSILIGNFAGTELKKFDVSFVGHQVIQSPTKLNQFFSVQKWGRNAVAVDSLTDEAHYLQLPPDHYFFGHGVFLPNGEHILISVMDQKNMQGKLHIYDTKSLKLVEQYKTAGINPHDVQISHNGQQLIVMHAGLPLNERNGRAPKSAITLESCISKLSISSGDLISQHVLDTGHRAYAHFLNLSDTDILCMGLSIADNYNEKNQPASLAYLSKNEVTNIMEDPLISEFIGEALSGRKLKNSDTAVVTLPEAQKIILVDLKNRSAILTLDAISPRGIVEMPDANYLITQSAKEEKFLVYSQQSKDLKALQKAFAHPGPLMKHWIATGAHMTEITWP